MKTYDLSEAIEQLRSVLEYDLSERNCETYLNGVLLTTAQRHARDFPRLRSHIQAIRILRDKQKEKR